MLPRIHSAESERTPRFAGQASLTTVHQDRTRALVRATGEWDLANVDSLAELIDRHQRSGRRFVRLDLSAVTFLDCACLDVLLDAHLRLLADRGTLVLTGVTPRIVRLLSFARLDGVLLTTSLSDLESHPDRLPAPTPRGSVVRPLVRPA
jgi:anti-anti-sigma factor